MRVHTYMHHIATTPVRLISHTMLCTHRCVCAQLNTSMFTCGLLSRHYVQYIIAISKPKHRAMKNLSILYYIVTGGADFETAQIAALAAADTYLLMAYREFRVGGCLRQFCKCQQAEAHPEH